MKRKEVNMSGPYCDTCEYAWWPPSIFGDDEGECRDPTKRIYYGSGEAANEAPTIRKKTECMNYKWNGNNDDETILKRYPHR